MDMGEASWSTTNTGKVFHSFNSTTAICRKNILAARSKRTEAQVDAALAQPWGISTQGYSKCERCMKLESAARDRQAASMEPSTGEGDYLPPAIEEVQEEETVTNTNITPELIEALRTLRDLAANSDELSNKAARTFNTLDNAGIFRAIDEATDYDVDPEPERVSKCTCPPTVREVLKGHGIGCPGDPAEWGDLAFTSAEPVDPPKWARLNFTESMTRR